MKKPQRAFKEIKLKKLSEVIQALNEALAEPIGLLLEVSDPKAFKAAMLQAKRHLNDPAIDCIQARQVSLPDGNIALVKGRRATNDTYTATGSKEVASLPRNPYERGEDIGNEARKRSGFFGKTTVRNINPRVTEGPASSRISPRDIRDLFSDDED